MHALSLMQHVCPACLLVRRVVCILRNRSQYTHSGGKRQEVFWRVSEIGVEGSTERLRKSARASAKMLTHAVRGDGTSRLQHVGDNTRLSNQRLGRAVLYNGAFVHDNEALKAVKPSRNGGGVEHCEMLLSH